MLINLEAKHIQKIFSQLSADRRVRLHYDGVQSILKLISPFQQSIVKLDNYDQLNYYVQTTLPSPLSYYINEAIKNKLDWGCNQDQIKLFRSNQKLVLKGLAAGIIEKLMDYLDDQHLTNSSLDEYHVNVVIKQDPGLSSLFGTAIPNFPHSDELRVSRILKMHNIKYTKGFKQALQNYIDVIVNMVKNQPNENILNLTRRFGNVDLELTTKYELIRQLKCLIVDHVIRNHPKTHEYTFSDVINNLKFLQQN